MSKADFTYRLETPDADHVGIEGYGVWTSDGENVGTVSALIERAAERYVVVEVGAPPVRSKLQAVPLDLVDIDHAALAVHLFATVGELEERTLELDPAKAVRHGGADAKRLAELPSELTPAPAPAGANAGPIDRPRLYVAIAVLLVAAFVLLGTAAVVTATGETWLLLLGLVGLALAGAAGVLAYGSYRKPYGRRGARHD